MLSATILLCALVPQDAAPPADVSIDDLRGFARVAALEFTEAELEQMLRGVQGRLGAFRALRAEPLDNGVPPATVFDPFLPGMVSRAVVHKPGMQPLLPANRPEDLSELYWADITTLASLIRSRQVSCVELATLFLDRLEALDVHLHCVITLRRDEALARAALLDQELADGKWRGLLHGIPWGAKDLLAAKDSRTTWGAQPYREQVLDLDATVVERLDAAGAVLVAKLTLGSLAMGDRWYGGRTRTPWNPERGSSGSSAGSASAVAAGGVPFAIGSETLGSIVSPSVRCGSTALRPTFGRVSRHGAMTLCWSMDKLGPMARNAVDLAIVFGVIQGPDGQDPSVREVPFVWPGPVSVDGTVIGYPKGAFGERPLEHPTLVELAGLGVQLREVELPDFDFGTVTLILGVEAACAFDDFSRAGLDDELVDQSPGAWPNYFRTARMIPAVEFLRAQRLRTKLMREMHAALGEVDLLVHPPYHGGLLGITNLTGHPTLVAPSGFSERGGVRLP
ncbi:MAG: amidase, partial [Planctomycetota bacterium]|nr:amidase [Planctomycetota bacterium]